MAGDDVPEYHRRRSPRVNGSTRPPDAAHLGERDMVLVVTRGHPFDRNSFFAVFESNPDIEWSHVEHPAAQRFFDPDLAAPYDCFVLYDMPGIDFGTGQGAQFFEPPADYVAGLQRLLDAGKPLVILHHACAAWPAWPQWSEIVGSHFLYEPGESRGEPMPDSGYVLEVEHTVTPVADHPVTEGIEPFTLTDELYLAPVFEDSVTPLFRSDFDFVDDNFSSASLAIRGQLNERGDWRHPPGSNLVGWVKTAGASPIVYLQFGDGPETYGNPNYRRVLANAIRWACSTEAAEWAAQNRSPM